MTFSSRIMAIANQKGGVGNHIGQLGDRLGCMRPARVVG